MTIGSLDGNKSMGGNSINIGQSVDAYSKSLQQQIANAQKQLQELAKNSEMDPETKMKKRQEIQRQISELNNQLRQHQMDLRRKQQQEKEQAAKAQRQKKQTSKDGEVSNGMSQDSMKAIVSAQSSMEQAQIQRNTANNLQNKAEIVKTEIKYSVGNANIEKKKEEVANLEAKAQEATASQMSTLADARNVISEAAKDASKDNGNVHDTDDGDSKNSADTAQSADKNIVAVKDTDLEKTYAGTDKDEPDSIKENDTSVIKQGHVVIGQYVDVKL